MPVSRRTASVAVLFMAMTALLPCPPAMAGGLTAAGNLPFTRTLTIPAEDYAAFSFSNNQDVTITISLVSGGIFDVYLMSQSWYNEYVDPTSSGFTTHRDYTRENAASFNVTTTDRSVSIVVIDNMMASIGGASPIGPIEVVLRLYTVSKPFDPAILVFCGIPGAIFGIVMFFIIRSALRKSARQKLEAEQLARQYAALQQPGPPGMFPPPPPPARVIPGPPPPPPPPP